ncbi:MAG: hypothetical protein M3680_23635 [Myxococcota bacterium]|nr:hypothetical protein [Myxococcota bacterium]
MTAAGYQHSTTGRAVLRSLVPVICPPEAQHLADAVLDHMELTIGASPALLRTMIGVGLRTYDLGAVPRHRRRAHKLAPAQAEAYFASWEHGLTPLHVQFARALNQLMSLSCYELPAMMERCSFRPGPWIDEVRERRLTVYRDDVRRADAAVLAPDPLRPGVHVGALRKERV